MDNQTSKKSSSDTNSLLDRLKQDITNPETLNLQARYDSETVRALEIDNDGRENYYKLRMGWSKFIGIVLSFSIAFQIIVTFMVGAKALSFEENQILINLIMGENFLQIIGLVYVIINFLYPKNN
ncbi:MAG: hypothetical protein Q8P72_04230 [Candidatus Roizmanbacteria bacterium]|nr:hypothetical protein [Candidatus Roizmanbacteria bacterium]